MICYEDRRSKTAVRDFVNLPLPFCASRRFSWRAFVVESLCARAFKCWNKVVAARARSMLHTPASSLIANFQGYANRSAA